MQQQVRPRWRPTRRQLLWGLGIVASLAVSGSIFGGYVFGWEWTGLVKDTNFHKRTLWDWMQLLIIPAVLAGVGLWFNRQQREQELQTADRRAQDEALQAYLDQMSGMLIPYSKDLPSLYKARPGDSLSSVARARTLTVLPRLDGDRKARVVQFLYESGLIAKGRPILDLGGADLSRANLSGAYLIYANLDRANLSGAYLGRILLGGSKLRKADLRGADLYRANLAEADLSDGNLRGADLRDAILEDANLSYADLRRADLRGADLRGAALSDVPFMRGATMPNGQKYEDWLKDKEGSGKDVENE
jgi:uncharacterized protein YjbI with pentapeptide repeats